VQGCALVMIPFAQGYTSWGFLLAMLGVGTALVYPTLLATVGDLAHPSWRGSAIGVYRLWRDLGYVAGALVVGTLVDTFGTSPAIISVGIVTIASGIVVATAMPVATGARFIDVKKGTNELAHGRYT